MALPEHVVQVNVTDSLLQKDMPFSSGATSYQGIQSQVFNAAKEGTKDFLFYMDSPGGEVAGLFELTNALKGYKDKFGLTYIGMVDTLSASACYAIAVVCDKIYATENAEIGSIGAVLGHWERTKLDKKQGIAYTIVRSRDQKAKGGIHEKLDAKTLKSFKEKLTFIDNKFTLHVTTSRTIDSSVIDGLDGRCVFAEEAKELGLIDEVLPFYDTELIFNQQETSMNDTVITADNVPADVKAKIEQDAIAAHTSSEAASAASTAATQAHEDALTQVRADSVSIMKLAETMEIPSSIALKAIEGGQDFATAKSNFEFIVASKTSMETIHASDDTVETPNEATTTAEAATNASAKPALGDC